MPRNEVEVYKDIYTNLEECIDILFAYYEEHRSMPLHHKEGMLRDIQVLLTVQRGFSEGGE